MRGTSAPTVWKGMNMAEGKKLVVQESDLDLSGLTVPLEWLLKSAPVDATAKGIVLASERCKVLINIDGKPVEHMITLYAQRAPLDEEEETRVAKVAAERKANAATKKADEQATRDREIKRATELTQQVAFEAMARATSQATQAAAAIETLNRLGVKVGQ